MAARSCGASSASSGHVKASSRLSATATQSQRGKGCGWEGSVASQIACHAVLSLLPQLIGVFLCAGWSAQPSGSLERALQPIKRGDSYSAHRNCPAPVDIPSGIGRVGVFTWAEYSPATRAGTPCDVAGNTGASAPRPGGVGWPTECPQRSRARNAPAISARSESAAQSTLSIAQAVPCVRPMDRGDVPS